MESVSRWGWILEDNEWSVSFSVLCKKMWLFPGTGFLSYANHLHLRMSGDLKQWVRWRLWGGGTKQKQNNLACTFERTNNIIQRSFSDWTGEICGHGTGEKRTFDGWGMIDWIKYWIIIIIIIKGRDSRSIVQLVLFFLSAILHGPLR